MSEEQQQPVRFRPNTKDAELWVNWLEGEVDPCRADHQLRLFQERDKKESMFSDLSESRAKAIQDAIQAGVLYVDAHGIGAVHRDRLEANLLFVKPLPNNQPS